MERVKSNGKYIYIYKINWKILSDEAYFVLYYDLFEIRMDRESDFDVRGEIQSK